MTKIKPFLRSFLVLGSVAAISTAATFAVLQSQSAVLSANAISTATAYLLVSNDNLSFNSTKTGFSFSNVTPGGPAVPASGYNFFLKNNGTANLSIKVGLNVLPTIPSGIDTGKVFLNFSRIDNGWSQTISLKALTDSISGGAIAFNDVVAAGTTAQYNLKVNMSSDAFNSTGGSTISGIDLVFSGIGS